MKTFAAYIFWLTLLALGLYFGQALIFMPGLWSSTRIKIWQTPLPVPLQDEKFLVTSGEDAELEAWFQPAASAQNGVRRIALLIHSQRSSLRTSQGLMKWFAKFGLPLYSFDYRGFGKSTGWPSEEGVYEDASAVLAKIAEKEKISPSEVILIGESAGGSVAARLASETKSKTIIILNPYVSWEKTLGENLKPYLVKLLHFRFSTSEYLRELKGSCVVILANSSDSAALNDELRSAASEHNNLKMLISSANERNVDLLGHFQAQIGEALNNCVSPK